MDNKVWIIKCEDYGQVAGRLAELIARMGGMEPFAAAGEKIVLKANLLRAATPQEAVTTHPAVVAAVAELVRQQGAVAVIADSPGGGYRFTRKTLDKIYRTCGMHQAAGQAGAELNWDTTSRSVSFPRGVLTRRFDVITAVLEADGVFNLCKLKTHLFTGMTGAVKNNFGVIPGMTKPGYHAKLHDVGRFCGMLLDLAQFVAPRLSIMDAVLAMEGDGPGTGDPRPVGLLLASCNPLALDVVAGSIMGLARAENPLLLEAEKRGLRPNRLEEVEVIGADPARLQIPAFKRPQASAGPYGFGRIPWYQRLFEPLFKDALTVKPRVIAKKCVACGACVKGCPMAAISFVKQHAFIDDDKCIRCYCCHEMCPEEAIGLHRSWLYRLARPV